MHDLTVNSTPMDIAKRLTIIYIKQILSICDIIVLGQCVYASYNLSEYVIEWFRANGISIKMISRFSGIYHIALDNITTEFRSMLCEIIESCIIKEFIRLSSESTRYDTVKINYSLLNYVSFDIISHLKNTYPHTNIESAQFVDFNTFIETSYCSEHTSWQKFNLIFDHDKIADNFIHIFNNIYPTFPPIPEICNTMLDHLNRYSLGKLILWSDDLLAGTNFICTNDNIIDYANHNPLAMLNILSISSIYTNDNTFAKSPYNKLG